MEKAYLDFIFEQKEKAVRNVEMNITPLTWNEDLKTQLGIEYIGTIVELAEIHCKLLEKGLIDHNYNEGLIAFNTNFNYLLKELYIIAMSNVEAHILSLPLTDSIPIIINGLNDADKEIKNAKFLNKKAPENIKYLKGFFKQLRRSTTINKNSDYIKEYNFENYSDAHPLIPVKILCDFYRLCNLKELLKTKISELDFISCFNRDLKPTRYLDFKIKNQFIYFLSKFDTIDRKIAKSNFGIKNYTNDKSEVNKRAKPKLEITSAIDKIVNGF